MKKYLFPCLYTLGIILVGSLLSSILYYFNITSDKFNTILLYLISIIAMFVGSLMLGKNTKYKGIISGLVYFTGWFIIMLISSLLIFKAEFKVSSIIYYLVLLVFSILGSVIGKNNQKETDAN